MTGLSSSAGNVKYQCVYRTERFTDYFFQNTVGHIFKTTCNGTYLNYKSVIYLWNYLNKTRHSGLL